ncbi:MAG: hypothetical protein JNM30_06195 [Rhodospirillales bacterium]|nr:hypothetical protein [Rhodospirillales bacterium]
MIEIQDYRASERMARSIMPSWWLAVSHQVDIFARIGFPVRIESTHEVGQLIDTMQENRYARFLTEFGGLSDAELQMLVRALVQSVLFQRAHLPRRAPLVPLSTMTSALALYKKIAAVRPTIGSILEVGPGCGYLSYFLASNPLLRDYSQVEACESFYILQSMINSHLFGHRFRDFAIAAAPPDQTLRVRKDVEPPMLIDEPELPAHNCHHFPWWTLASLLDRKYDVVTSNANLSEFSSEALRDYLTIFVKAMKDDAVFVVQCTGFPGHATLEQLFDTLHEFRLAPLLCALANEIVTPSMLSNFTPTYSSLGFDRREFALNTILLVKDTHPLFYGAWERRNYRHGFAVEFEPLQAMFRADGPTRRPSREEVLALVKAELGKMGPATAP